MDTVTPGQLPSATQAFGAPPTATQAFGADPNAPSPAQGGGPQQPQQNEPSITNNVLNFAKRGAQAMGRSEVAGLKQNAKDAASFVGSEARVASRVTQGLMELPESFIDKIIGNDMMLRELAYTATQYRQRGQQIPESVKNSITTQLKIHHAVYRASEALGEYTDKELPPPSSTIGKYAEGIDVFLAGMALPIPDKAYAGLDAAQGMAAGLESASPRFAASTDAERSLAILRAKGYKILPGDMEAHLKTPKTMIARALQTVGASRGYALSLDNVERAERDINVMFHRDEDLPLGESELEDIRDQAGAPYDAVRNMKDMQPDSDMQSDAEKLGDEMLDMRLSGFKTPFSDEDYRRVADLRSDLNRPSYTGRHIDLLLKGLRRGIKDKLRPNATAADQYVGMLYKEGSELLERFIAREADRQGLGDLANQLRSARRTIAQTWDVQGALEGGRVSPRRLAALRRLRKGRALDPTLDMIAKGYEYAPRSFQPATKAGLTEGRQYMFSWALWGLLRGDPRLMAVYLGEHGARKMSESELLQLKPEEIGRALGEGKSAAVDESSKAVQERVQEEQKRRSAIQTLRMLMGQQAEEGSSSGEDQEQP